MKYVFIGHGRVASHLSYYLGQRGHKTHIWSRRSQEDPHIQFLKADVICISTRDKEIESVVQAYQLKKYKKPIVHFSGSLHLDGVAGFHPLLSFGPQPYALKAYEEMHFVGTTEASLFNKIFPKLENTYHKISPKNLALYHAYCSMASNFPQILWDHISAEFQSELNLPAKALHPLIGRSAVNFINNSSQAITGPIVRNDQKTIIRHLDALKDKNSQNVYFSFLNLFRKENLVEGTNEHIGV